MDIFGGTFVSAFQKAFQGLLESSHTFSANLDTMKDKHSSEVMSSKTALLESCSTLSGALSKQAETEKSEFVRDPQKSDGGSENTTKNKISTREEKINESLEYPKTIQDEQFRTYYGLYRQDVERPEDKLRTEPPKPIKRCFEDVYMAEALDRFSSICLKIPELPSEELLDFKDKTERASKKIPRMDKIFRPILSHIDKLIKILDIYHKNKQMYAEDGLNFLKEKESEHNEKQLNKTSTWSELLETGDAGVVDDDKHVERKKVFCPPIEQITDSEETHTTRAIIEIDRPHDVKFLVSFGDELITDKIIASINGIQIKSPFRKGKVLGYTINNLSSHIIVEDFEEVISSPPQTLQSELEYIHGKISNMSEETKLFTELFVLFMYINISMKCRQPTPISPARPLIDVYSEVVSEKEKLDDIFKAEVEQADFPSKLKNATENDLEKIGREYFKIQERHMKRMYELWKTRNDRDWTIPEPYTQQFVRISERLKNKKRFNQDDESVKFCNRLLRNYINGIEVKPTRYEELIEVWYKNRMRIDEVWRLVSIFKKYDNQIIPDIYAEISVEGDPHIYRHYRVSVYDDAPDRSGDVNFANTYEYDPVMGYELTDYRYWLRHLLLDTVCGIPRFVTWFSPAPVIKLPVIYIPIVVVKIKKLILVLGIGIAGLGTMPLLIIVNSSQTDLSYLFPLTEALEKTYHYGILGINLAIDYLKSELTKKSRDYASEIASDKTKLAAMNSRQSEIMDELAKLYLEKDQLFRSAEVDAMGKEDKKRAEEINPLNKE